MAPKRKAAQAPSASQPLPSTRPVGRKRRLSDASEISVASERPPSSSQGANSKRRKKGRPAAASSEPEVIVEEREQEEALIVHHQDAMDLQLGGDATYEPEMPDEAELVEDSIEVFKPRSKHVHFGGGSHDDDEEEDEEPRQTATNITPHPRKTSVKHRVTMSPMVSVNSSSKRTASGSRSSLPPAWSQASPDPAKVIQELQFVPLREALNERVKRRLRRSHLSEEQNAIEDHDKADKRTSLELNQLKSEAAEKEARIQDLNYQLETQRQLVIDVAEDVDAQQRVLALERDLDETRRELALHMDEHRLGDDELDDDMLVFDSQEDIAYPQLPAASSSAKSNVETNGHKTTEVSIVKTSTRDSLNTFGRTSLNVTKLTAEWDTERQKFEDAILALSREAATAKGELQVLQIEIGALGFGGDGVNSKVILESIRESFARVRESIENLLPDTLPEDASTQDVLEILIANTREFVTRLRSQDQDLFDKDGLITDLKAQVEGLLDHLAAAEIKYQKLHDTWNKLDQASDIKAREMEELEEEMKDVEAERDELRKELADASEEARVLGEDHAANVQSIERLQMSLERYREEEARLTELIERMEKEHGDDIAQRAREREKTVQDLENRLDVESGMRSEAEKVADDRQTEITQLDLQIEEISTTRDILLDELKVLKAERDAEKGRRQTAEGTLVVKNAEVEDLTARVDRLEDDLESLTTQLDELRKANETERQQREAAENDLDDRNAELDDINRKLDVQGQEANKLRMKLFEVQQENEATVKDLNMQMSDRDEQYQADIAHEVARREAADDLVQQRAASILELQTRIEELELQMRSDVAERDERIEALEAELQDRKTEIEDLKMDLRASDTDLENVRAEKDQRIEELDGSIAALQETVSEHEERIQTMLQQAITDESLHNSEIEDRNAEIADLHATVTELRTGIADLELEKGSLERRVEQEATAMLEMGESMGNEIDDLKAQLQDKQDKIMTIETKAVAADHEWQEVLALKEEEMEELKTKGEASEEVIVTMTTDFEAMRQRMREYVETSQIRIKKLQAAVLTAKTVADDEGDALRGEGFAVLEELEGYDLQAKVEIRRTVTKTVPVAASQQAQGGAAPNKGRGRKSKRVADSGIGLEGEAA
ncbi:hypothetical protein LTR53_006245 [Teratosphaeriaceae sp. CCFEE 6253]|nr:hypothetical protein LTR53_006245 [Teratosphaeriaceae sp. CCFEE 6253]